MKDNYDEQYQNILDKFEELKKEAKVDCKVIKEQLENSFNNTELLIKWLNKYSQWNSLHRIYDTEKKKKFRVLYEYYKTEYELKLSTKDELLLFIESDSNYVNINNLYALSKDVVNYINSVIDILKGRAFEIREFSTWFRFINGQK